MYLDPRATPVDPPALYRAFRAAGLSPPAIAVLTAHAMLETGDGTRMRNFLIGVRREAPRWSATP